MNSAINCCCVSSPRIWRAKFRLPKRESSESVSQVSKITLNQKDNFGLPSTVAASLGSGKQPNLRDPRHRLGHMAGTQIGGPTLFALSS